MKDKSARQWFVSGRVQGVGFRFFVEHKAAEFGLSGWTRNLADGRVEVYAIGDPQALSDMAAALHVGPRMADVRGVEEKSASLQRLTGFTIR